MKSIGLLISLLLITLSVTAAQESTRTNPPPRREMGSVVSPEVHADKTVTFRLRAADAKEVKVGGEWPGGTKSLTNTEGVWSVTIGPLEPDIYGYNLTLDGVQIVDPNNPWVKPMRAARTSVVE